MSEPVPASPRLSHRVLVTGASGFVGRALVAEAAARGWRVRAASRSGTVHEGAWEPVRISGLGPGTDWHLALAGCDAVVHLAARVHVVGDSDGSACACINLEGTKRLAEQAARAGVHRFVFISTVKVLGDCSPHGRALSDIDSAAPEDAYARSKFAAEQALLNIAEQTGMEVVVLRPPLVYGPGVKANFLAMMTRIAHGWPLPLGALQSRRSFCYLGNLNDAILTVLEHPEAPGKRFLVGDGETLLLPEFAVRLGKALGRPARLLPVPASLLRVVGTMLGRGDQVGRLTKSLEVDISGIQHLLGWRPPWTIDVGLAETARWYRQTHAQ